MKPSLADIPRGNTCPGVNRAIIEYLLSKNSELAGRTVLDVPCGNGEFLDAVKLFFAECRAIGADIAIPAGKFEHEFHQFDAESGCGLDDVRDCSVVTCISGVMEFDNTLGFLRTINKVLSHDATVIVTNDNLQTVRDRIFYFLFGRFRQYKTTIATRGPTWKILHLTNLIRCLNDAGFHVTEIQYVIGKWTEWHWLPVATPIYLIQMLYFLTNERQQRISEKRKFFPFKSLLARHYLLICEKKSEPAASASPVGSR
jgi:hypothetical protein